MPINKTNVKKDGKQQYRVRVNYTDANGKPCQIERTVYGLAEANAMEQRLISEYKEKRTVSCKMTVQQLYDEYMKYHENETRASSNNSTANKLQMRVLPYLGNCRLDKLTQQVLANWKIEIGKQDIALRTKKNAYTSLSALLNYAVKMNYITKNPLTVLGNFKDTNTFEKPAKDFDYYTSEQFVKYIAACENNCQTVIDWGYYVFFNIAFFTGARKGEINALKWSDIDGNIMHIRRSIAQKTKGEDIETPPKNKSSIRDLQMPTQLIEILNEHKERQRAASRLFSDDYRICGGERPLRDTSIDKHNRKFAIEADLPRIRIHDFRHSHASLLANEGINIQEIARRLGHSNVQITWNTYSHLYPREEDRAIEVLERISLK